MKTVASILFCAVFATIMLGCSKEPPPKPDIPEAEISLPAPMPSSSQAGSTAEAILPEKAQNSLEKSLDLDNGTKGQWEEFIDEGGLNTQSDLYGIRIYSAQVNFDGKTGKLLYAGLVTGLESSPKSIRQALNNVCGSKEGDWEKQAGFNMGEVSNPKAKCIYTTNDQYHEIGIERK